MNFVGVRRRINQLSLTASPRELGVIVDSIVQALPYLERDLRDWSARLAARPDRDVTPPAFPSDWVADSLTNGRQKFTRINGPVLSIVAAPREIPAAIASDPAAITTSDSAYVAGVMPQMNAFKHGVPQARVLLIPHSNHYVYRSHEAEVLREIRAFIGSLDARH